MWGLCGPHSTRWSTALCHHLKLLEFFILVIVRDQENVLLANVRWNLWNFVLDYFRFGLDILWASEILYDHTLFCGVVGSNFLQIISNTASFTAISEGMTELSHFDILHGELSVLIWWLLQFILLHIAISKNKDGLLIRALQVSFWSRGWGTLSTHFNNSASLLNTSCFV